MESGTIIEDRYSVEDFLGEGGAGKVYTCRDKNLKAKFAVKILHSTASEKAMARFHSEAKATAKLNHQNVVKVFDFGQTKDGDAYLILEYCKGQNLDEFISKNISLSNIELLEIIHSIASGLDHAHNNGVIHRDIKPSNIILAEQPEGTVIPKIVDFGVAKIQSQDLFLTKSRNAIGSPRYMSPEAIDVKKVDQQSDIYSFGCLAYELFARKLPFDGKSSLDIMKFKSSVDFPKLSESKEIEIPEVIDELLAKCLVRDPKDRFKNTGELLQKIEQCMESTESFNEEMISLDSAKAPATKKKVKVKSVILAGLLFACLTLVIGLQLKNNEVSKPVKSEFTKKSSPFKPTELFKKLDYRAIHRFEINGQTWHRFTGINDAVDLKPLLAETDIKRLRLAQDNLLGKEISCLAKMNLLGLDIVGSSVDDTTIKELSKFKSLEQLSLRKTKHVKDESVRYLVNLTNLRKLDLSDTDISDRCVDYLAKVVHLEEVSFDSCDNFHGNNIGKLKNLKVLDLINSGFMPRHLKNLVELKQLERLELSNLRLVDKDLIPLSRLKISKLSLNKNTKLTDSTLELLAKIPSLKYVSINEVPNISRKAELAFKIQRQDCKLMVRRSSSALK